MVRIEPRILQRYTRGNIEEMEMAGLSTSGQMKVSVLQEGFLTEFGLTLRVYDGRSFADPTQMPAQVLKKKGNGKGLSNCKTHLS